MPYFAAMISRRQRLFHWSRTFTISIQSTGIMRARFSGEAAVRASASASICAFALVGA